MPDADPVTELREAALCGCGCGRAAPIARSTDSRRGFVKGQPIRFIRGHNRKTRVRPVAERFWENVAKTDTCWLWTAHTHRGYGKFFAEGRHVVAHRWAYERLVGPIPKGLTLDHLCRNRGCVNPAHLEPVTVGENARRGNPAIRTNRCKRDHEFTDANTYWHSGRRICKACMAERQRQRRRREREGRAAA